VQEPFFAISVERRTMHPCVTAIAEVARNALFAPAVRRRAGARRFQGDQRRCALVRPGDRLGKMGTAVAAVVADDAAWSGQRLI